MRSWLVAVTSAFLVLGSLASCILGFWKNRDFYNDDALVSLRYAQNLLSGHGLVWNPGERVEGYTNFLFVLGVSGLGARGMDLEVASRMVNVAAFVGLSAFLVGACWRECRRNSLPRRLALVPGALVFTSFVLLCNVLGGLEAPVVAALVAVALYLAARALETGQAGAFVGSGLAFALACMTRPDAGIFAAVAGTAMVWPRRSVERGGLLRFVAGFVTLYVPYFLLRWSYYGSPFPNTFYVKAEGLHPERLVAGLEYVAASFVEPPYLLPVALSATVTLILAGRAGARTWLLAVSMVAGLVYLVAIGGDHMPAFRLLAPLVPLAALVVFDALCRLDRAVLRRPGVWALLVAVLLAGTALQLGRPALNPQVEDPAAFVGRIIGRWIRVAWPQGSLVALNTAGSTPYHAPRNRYIDMLGLNDAHIAHRRVTELVLPWQRVPGHEKGDGAYVLDRKPDFIIIGPAQGADIGHPWFLSDLEMAVDPRLRRDYRLRRVDVPTSEVPEYRRHVETYTGRLIFTYYERVTPAREDSGSAASDRAPRARIRR